MDQTENTSNYDRLYSYNLEYDNQEEDEEQTDLNVYDTKMEHISITKIDTKRFLRNIVISDINDHKPATDLIQRIHSKRKRKHDRDSLSPNNKRPKLDNEATVNCASTSSNQNNKHDNEHDQNKDGNLTTQSQSPLKSSTSTCDAGIQVNLISNQSSNKCRELKLNRHVNQLMKEKGKNYNLKMFLVETKQDSQFSKLFSKLLTEKGRERLCREKEICKSYILYFYRNVQVEHNDNEFRSEIYALTTGSTWLDVSEYADKDFSKLVEKRTLTFPFQRVEYKRDIGTVFKETKTARTGHEITFPTLDFLGKLIGNRTRSICKNSSLFAEDLEAFCKPNGKHVASKFEVREKSMKILRKLSISQLGRVLDHFSKICLQRKTFLEDGTSKQNEETDDTRFEMHDFMAEVTDVQTIGKLNESLHQFMEQSMNGTNSNLFLVHENFEKWSKTDEVVLYAYKHNTVSGSKKTTRRQRQKIETWFNPPGLGEVMASLRKNVCNEFKPEWLTDVNIKFRATDTTETTETEITDTTETETDTTDNTEPKPTTEAPLKKFIFRRFNAGEIGTYIYNHGKWIEMKAQYFYYIEQEFIKEMRAHIMKQNELPQLLPWKHPGGKNKDGFKVVEFDEIKMRPKWRTHFKTMHGNAQFDTVLDEVDSLSQGRTNLTFNFGELEKMTSEERTAHLYRLLECNLNEDDYNAAHTLFNMILPDKCDTEVITCDKKTPHGIELCDILIYNDTTTYLVHVKAGFDGGPIREVCSQIRNAADNIFREHTISKGTGIIDEYWDVLTKEADKSTTHENVVKRQLDKFTKKKFKELFHITRTIIFVLACRDTRTTTDFTQDIPHSLDVPLSDKSNKRLTPQIIDDMKKNGYITDKDELTNKFILENKETRVKAFRCMESIKTKKEATEIHDVLVSELPKSKSTIAKMEIIRLAHDFERYSTHKKNIQLKLYNVEAVFSDVN